MTKDIYELELHEQAQVGGGVRVIKVPDGFLYIINAIARNNKGEEHATLASSFVPCKDVINPYRHVFHDCEYFNDGLNPKYEYKWSPDNGAYCEGHHQFFRVIEGAVYPDCHNCSIMDKVRDDAKKVKRFVPPTKEEVEKYAKSKGHVIDGQKFIDYYAVNGWHDNNGKKVKNWKQKCLAVWLKDDNKIEEQKSIKDWMNGR